MECETNIKYSISNIQQQKCKLDCYRLDVALMVS